MKPDRVMKELAAARTLAYATGMDDRQIFGKKIAIIAAPNEDCPGHMRLGELAQAVKIGVAEEGGVGRILYVGLGICDGFAMGQNEEGESVEEAIRTGMPFSLVSSDINRNAAVAQIRGHGFYDGVVFIAACDKNIPGYLRAAAAMSDMPAVFVTAGPMMPGNVDGEDAGVLTGFTADGAFKKEKIDKEMLDEICRNSCEGSGSCEGMYTANTMACITEGLGLTVPGMASAHSVSAKKHRLSVQSGRTVMRMLKEGITTKDILTEAAFRNAIRVDMALGGSTNTGIHIPAIAKERGIEVTIDTFNELGDSTPNLVRISPTKADDGTMYRMIHFEREGGMPIVMSRLRESLETKEVMTVTGPLEERLAQVKDNGKNDVIKTFNNPYSPTGGIVFYRGTLAPEGAVIKESAVDPSVPRVMKYKAKVFDSEIEVRKYILSGKVEEGDALIIRYEGLAGAPGMPEMLYPTSDLLSLDPELTKKIVLITDARFSGGTRGPCYGHVLPEAFNGGPIALVKDGDMIEVNRDKRELNLLVDEEELGYRRERWERVVKPAGDNLLEEFRAKHTTN